jgi:cell division protein FtsA
MATRMLGQRVRLGRPAARAGPAAGGDGGGFCSAVGLCLFAAHPQDEWWDFEIPAERYPARSLRRAVKWFKDNW